MQPHTAKLGEARHIRMPYDLGMLKTRSEGGHIDTFKRRLECIEDKSVCSVTNRMDILETAHDFLGKGKDVTSLTGCQPSLRNFWILVVKTSWSILMKPLELGLSA
jgi:hypothetical protein